MPGWDVRNPKHGVAVMEADDYVCLGHGESATVPPRTANTTLRELADMGYCSVGCLAEHVATLEREKASGFERGRKYGRAQFRNEITAAHQSDLTPVLAKSLELVRRPA